MIALALAAVLASFQPAAPTVGDRITVQFDRPVHIERSPDFEIVSEQPRRVVIRTFMPRPLVLRANGTEVIIPVRSVLGEKDTLRPAGLKPPRRLPYPPLPFALIGIAAWVAMMAWLAVALLARRKAPKPVPVLTPAERFRQTVLALRKQPQAKRWALLADATRAYLAATTYDLSPDLTTSELLRRLEQPGVVEEILKQGDLEKFAPWGAEARDFEEVAKRALEVAA